MKKLLPRITSATLIVAWFLISVSISHAQTPTENKSSSAVISGTVSTRDGDNLPNARVSVGRAMGGIGTRPQVLRLDSSGHFETPPLEPGLYFVSVFAPGYITDITQTPAQLWYRPGDSASFTLTKGGVITGTVKNSSGDPIVAIQARAIMVKNKDGKAVQFVGAYRSTLTDDRGIYRLYGLPAGTYIVSAGGTSRPGFTVQGTSIYESYVPTYAQSATRDTATEIVVNNGDEATVDVQFREERGHVVSGTIAGARLADAGGQIYGVGVTLFDLQHRMEVANGSANQTNNFSFALYGIPDGEYEMYAAQGSPTGDSIMSPARLIKVLGADISGINLPLAAPGSIDGRVVLESDPKAACGKHKTEALLETTLSVRRYEPEQNPKNASTGDVPLVFRNSARPAMLDAKGTFEIKSLQPGAYRIDPREPAPGWFIKSITAGPAARPLSVAREGVTVRNGERVSGVTVTISEGAAQLVGRITVAEGQTPGSNVRVYLLPAEREAADNVIRFYEARSTNGKFTVDNINPGKYFVIARPAEENEYGIAKSLRFDAAFRAKVMQEAQAAKKDVTFKACEQMSDYELPLTASTSP